MNNIVSSRETTALILKTLSQLIKDDTLSLNPYVEEFEILPGTSIKLLSKRRLEKWCSLPFIFPLTGHFLGEVWKGYFAER